MDRLLRIALLGLLPETELRIAEIIISVLLHGHLLGVETVLESGRCPRQVTGFVSRRPRIELQFGLCRLLRGRRGILLL